MLSLRKVSFYVAVSALVLGLVVGLLDIWEIIEINDITSKIFLSSLLLLVTGLLGMLVDRLLGSDASSKADEMNKERH